ncbi:MAG: alkene reductase [Sulfuricurvum sp.]|nr:alkene reductase [Sulfuricurvum sp.]
MNPLLQPLKLGDSFINNRLIMAPMTRCRALDNHVPSPLMADYYAQRATAGLIIAEATMAMENNSAFWMEPGIYSNAQVSAWKVVTDAVHAKGGKIFLQIWHGGRACHPLLNNGVQPVSSSAIAIVHGEVHTPQGMQPYTLPRELTIKEIQEIVLGFKQAAINAKEAGFDGVEVHGANGYLIDQFLRDGTNKRTDQYGGSFENRGRFLFEILEAVCSVWGSENVGLRISPLNSYNDIIDSEPIGLYAWLASELNRFNLGYLHVMRSDFFAQQSGDVMTPIRAAYKGTLIGNMGYTPDEAFKAIDEGEVDAVAFGAYFIANPDFVERIKCGAPLNQPDSNTFYTPGSVGYTDYPFMDG